jgi:protein TonB
MALVAAALHAGVVTAAVLMRGDQSEARPARRPVMTIDRLVELTAPDPPRPPESAADPPAPPRAAAPIRAARPTTGARTPESTNDAASPPPPAQAGQVVAAAPSTEPADFTGFDIATGEGPQFAGGVTASSGTNTRAVHTSVVDPNAPPDRPQGERDLAAPVRLPARSWRCPWPRQADALGIDEQVVVLRVAVEADGRISSAELVDDPGHGFGDAALVCAREATFEPARDSSGRPVSATSPPVRVRFTR